LSFMHKELFN